ncbi:MAG TPA: SPW repeat protein [Gemmataceae bacterium]|nr:SPW repeat protein [Gemmataceae bacterium]
MVNNRVGLNGAEGARTASVLTLIAGIWLIISPFWMGFYTTATPLWNTLIVGIVVTILALVRACYPAENSGLSGINLILGLWLIVSPFFLPYHNLVVPLRVDLITGIIVAVTALWSMMATPTYARMSRYSR